MSSFAIIRLYGYDYEGIMFAITLMLVIINIIIIIIIFIIAIVILLLLLFIVAVRTSQYIKKVVQLSS